MANERIKDLTTEALVTSPDDYAVIDGATNGTRKIKPANIGSPHYAPRPGLISAGTSAAGTTPDNAVLAFGTGDLTIGFWFERAVVFSTQRILVRKHDGVSSGFWVELVPSGSTLRLRLGATNYDFAGVPFTDAALQFAMLRLDRDGNAYLDVNGANFASKSIAAQAAESLTSTGPLTWFSSGSTHCDGMLGACWIIDGLLTATDGANIYRAGSIAPLCVYTPDATTGQSVATINGLSFYTWPDFGQGYGPIIRDRSGNNQHAVMGASGLTHAVPRNPPGISRRAPTAALVGDGSAGSFVRATLNTQNPGTGDFTLWWDGVYSGSDAATTSRMFAALSPSTSDVLNAGAFWLSYNSAEGLKVLMLGATTADALVRNSGSGLLGLVAGQRIVFIVTRGGATCRIYLGIAGDLFDVTALFSGADTGTPPAWSDAVQGGNLVVGYRNISVSSAIVTHDVRLANVAMTEAQLRTEYERGEPGPEWLRGSNKAIHTSNFSAGVNSYGSDFDVDTGNVDTDADGTGVPPSDDWLRVINNAVEPVYCYTGVFAAYGVLANDILPAGTKIRVRADVFVQSGSPATHVLVSNVALASNTAATPITAGSVNSIDLTYTLSSAVAATGGGRCQIGLSSNGTTTNSLVSGTAMYLKNVVVTVLGYTARLRPDTAAGLTALNAAKSSTNDATDFLISTGGVTEQPKKRRQIIRDTLVFAAAGDLQIRGANVVDTTRKWRIAYVGGNSSASVNHSLGNASAGAQYISAQAGNGDFDLRTLVTTVISGANLWWHASGAATVAVCIVLEEMD